MDDYQGAAKVMAGDRSYNVEVKVTWDPFDQQENVAPVWWGQIMVGGEGWMSARDDVPFVLELPDGRRSHVDSMDETGRI